MEVAVAEYEVGVELEETAEKAETAGGGLDSVRIVS